MFINLASWFTLMISEELQYFRVDVIWELYVIIHLVYSNEAGITPLLFFLFISSVICVSLYSNLQDSCRKNGYETYKYSLQ